MTPRSPAQVSLVLDGEDQAGRLERFRTTHPDAPVLLLGTRPRAWVGDQKLEHPTLCGLLDDLEEMFHPAMPNMARVYDYWLSGKDNYPADRAEAERLLGIYPPLRIWSGRTGRS